MFFFSIGFPTAVFSVAAFHSTGATPLPLKQAAAAEGAASELWAALAQRCEVG